MKIMKYKLNINALLTRMGEYGQNYTQKLNYLKHTLSCLMSKEHWVLFNFLAGCYDIYYMILQKEFEMFKLRFNDYLIILEKTQDELIIEINEI